MFTYWDVSEDEDSGYYGENGNPANSLHFEITYGNNGLGPSYGYVIRHDGEIVNSVPATTFDDYWMAKDEMNEALPIDSLNEIAPDYDPSIYEKLGERKMSAVFWGKAPYGDDVNGYYGTEGDYANSLRYMVGEMVNGNGFLVFNNDNDCLCEMDGFASDYEAQVGAEQWIEENAPQYITASVRSANANWTYWNEYLDPYGYTCLFYGVKESPLKSIVITLPEKDGMYKYIISDNTSINDIAESDYVFSDKKQAFEGADAWVQEHAGEYLQQYEQQYAYSSHVTADEDSLSDDLDDMNNDDLTEDDMVSDAIASRRDIRKSDRELVFWDRDVGIELASERYGINRDERHSLVITVGPDDGEYNNPSGFSALIEYPVLNGFYGKAGEATGNTMDEALQNAEDFCRYHAMEYLNLSDVTSSVKKSSPELVLWGSDMNDYEGVEYYGESGDNRRSLELDGEGGWADDDDDYDYQVHVKYPTNMNSWDDAYTAYGDTLREAFDDAEKWCLENGSEYLYRNSDVYDVDGNKIVAKRTFRTAKRKWTARERLALINEERFDGDDEFDDLI